MSRADSGPYDFIPHAHLGDLAAQVYGLTRLAFGTYEGVLVPSEAHRRWYVQRPGMDRDLSRAAVCNGHLVSSLFITTTRMRLGDDLLRVGIVDTVMTHPEHRRRGLARTLLNQALAGMTAARIDAALLYTVRDSMPYRLYQSARFLPHMPVRYMEGAGTPDNASSLVVRTAGSGQADALRLFLNHCYAHHDGFVPYDQSLWHWHKVARPESLPARLLVAESQGDIIGTATVCSAPIVTRDGAKEAYTITDLAAASTSDIPSLLGTVLATLPGDASVRMLVASVDRPVNTWLQGNGFAPTATEVAMVRPISAAGRRALENAAANPAAPWYVLVESIVGL